MGMRINGAEITGMKIPPIPSYVQDMIDKYRHHEADNLEVHEAIHKWYTDNYAQEVNVETPEYLREEAARLEARAKQIESLPVDDFEEGNVITFVKRFPVERGNPCAPECKEYHYAAIKAAGRWHHTGKGRNYQGNGAPANGYLSWLQLLEFIGFDNLDSITYVTAEAPLV